MRDIDSDRSATCAPAQPSSGYTLGDITSRLSAIEEAVTEFRVAYENDIQVIGLAERANTIRALSQSLASTLYSVDNALNELTT